MKHGTEEETIMEVVYCRCFKKNMTAETCRSCDFDGGIHEEPLYGDKPEGGKGVIGHKRYQVCTKPRLVDIVPVGAVKGEN